MHIKPAHQPIADISKQRVPRIITCRITDIIIRQCSLHSANPVFRRKLCRAQNSARISIRLPSYRNWLRYVSILPLLPKLSITEISAGRSATLSSCSAAVTYDNPATKSTRKNNARTTPLHITINSTHQCQKDAFVR